MGVGGGGCNAINYLYKQGIQDVTLLVCNTDKMSLAGSSVPSKLQIGNGLGVGGKPEKAKQYALYYRRYGWRYRYGCFANSGRGGKGNGNPNSGYCDYSFCF